MSEEHWSQEAADDILEDLCCRKGVGDELESVRDGDEDTWNEIRFALARIVRGKAPPPPPMHGVDVPAVSEDLNSTIAAFVANCDRARMEEIAGFAMGGGPRKVADNAILAAYFLEEIVKQTDPETRALMLGGVLILARNPSLADSIVSTRPA